MKKTSQQFVVLMCLLIGAACGDKKNETGNAAGEGKATATVQRTDADNGADATCTGTIISLDNPDSVITQEQAVDLESYTVASKNIQRYRSTMAGKLGTLPVLNGTGLNTIDILSVLGVPFSPDYRTKHVRYYIGMDETYAYKVYIVPVVDIPDQKITADNPGCDALLRRKVIGIADTLFVYELNYPCPNVCAKNDIFTSNR